MVVVCKSDVIFLKKIWLNWEVELHQEQEIEFELVEFTSGYSSDTGVVRISEKPVIPEFASAHESNQNEPVHRCPVHSDRIETMKSVKIDQS